MTIGISPLVKEARRMREARGIAQGAVSSRAGFTKNQVHRWECGKNHPSIHAFETYLEALGYRLKIEPIAEQRDGPSA